MSRVPDVSAVVAGLLQVVEEQQKSSGTISPEVLRSLNLVHSHSLTNALDLIDGNKVTKVVSTSGRWVYQVIGSSGTPYVCFPHSVFCQCPAFKFSVLKKRESVICKHVLAARLATAMGVTEEKFVSNEYIVDVLTHLD
ncbi:hypothetical protein Pcinc_022943 [Petrolisthes cinctipes]|uniref:SWIM-type domain-containing protein n=1 Tax=Petrolisthes cinctipes TaxID=88211 RepID=A0AAE1KHJ3_PETCI|nr:hypothetical protein Pcinc_022943 [Petrolisthes cinctipes]